MNSLTRSEQDGLEAHSTSVCKTNKQTNQKPKKKPTGVEGDSTTHVLRTSNRQEIMEENYKHKET